MVFLQMKIFRNSKELIKLIKNYRSLGFVPTMGALHKGHIKLIKLSQKKCVNTIVSIFVNPNQFNNKNDFFHQEIKCITASRRLYYCLNCS